jgi:hypothetical protein
MNSTLTIEQAKELVKTRDHLYKAMLRNGWYLPSLKSSIITQDYMNDVREGKFWCPKYKDLKTLPCPDPPGKEFLLDEVVKITTEKNLDIGAHLAKVPDRNWLI